MTTDLLRQLVNDYDRASARHHRLTDRPVLPPRSGLSTRRVCGSCWAVADAAAWQVVFQAWRAKHSKCEFYKEWSPECQGHWQTKKNTWLVHRYEANYFTCPSCGADDLHEVTP